MNDAQHSLLIGNIFAAAALCARDQAGTAVALLLMVMWVALGAVQTWKDMR